MSSKIKVLHTYRTYFPDPPGGLQEAIRQICLSTKKRGIENTIFTLSPNPYPKQLIREEACVVRSKSWFAPASCDIGGTDAFYTYNNLCQLVDIFHYYFPWPFADILHIQNKSDRPSVLTYISDVVRQKSLAKIYSPLMHNTLNRMRVIVANCPAYVSSSPVLSCPEIRKKIEIIPLGIDEDSLSKEFDNKILLKHGLTTSEPYFLFIGVLRYYKGISFLIEAAKTIQAKIVIAGSGPYLPEIKANIDKLNLKNVILTGQVSNAEKNSLLQNCYGFVLPSHLRSEAFGMVLVEASIYSKPLISCEIGSGTSFININNETGIVVKPSDASALSNAMNILIKEPQAATTLGLNARYRYEKYFSGPALGSAYSELFHEVLRRG